mgnify:CR=1 FL=1
MAVDANVLVFERSKEEFGAGKSLRLATMQGFKKAWTAIADSNATTVLAAIILFFFATGAVRGFGITLTVGVAVSMFTALVITRMLVEIVMRSRRVASHPAAFGMNVGGKLRRRLQENPIDLEVCTRCNACVRACPEDAIGFDYQVALAKCKDHRDCVKACGSVGAIDFSRTDVSRKDAFDLVLDLSGGVTGEIHFVDSGYNIVAMPQPDTLKTLDAAEGGEGAAQ